MSQEVLIDYTNHRGERGERRIEPLRMYFGSTQWHPDDQWLLEARDVKEDAMRTFAMKDIHNWKTS